MEGEHQLQMKKAEKEKKKTGPQKTTGSAVTEPDSLRCQTLQEENQVCQVHQPCQYFYFFLGPENDSGNFKENHPSLGEYYII